MNQGPTSMIEVGHFIVSVFSFYQYNVNRQSYKKVPYFITVIIEIIGKIMIQIMVKKSLVFGDVFQNLNFVFAPFKVPFDMICYICFRDC